MDFTWFTIDICACALAFTLSNVLIPQIIHISFTKKLFDEPCKRKIHENPVPRLGGFVFFPVVVLVLAIMIGAGLKWYQQETSDIIYPIMRSGTFCFSCLMILWIFGLADDLVGVRYRAKFCVQILCAILMICGGMYLDNFHGVLGIGKVPVWIGYPFTVLLTVFIINSVNLIDGIDGLCSGLCGSAMLLFGVVFCSNEDYGMSVVAFCTLGVLVSFFYYNVFGNAQKRKKVFMGDTGSLTIGMLITFMVMRLLQYHPDTDFSGINNSVIAFSPLIVPCFDVVRVYFYRLRNKKNPFLPDNNHLHHRLLQKGWTQHRAMLTIMAYSWMLSIFNILIFRHLNVNAILILDIMIWYIGMYFFVYRKKTSPVRELSNR